jgi:hypoxanthine phosphoribosyltransferase
VNNRKVTQEEFNRLIGKVCRDIAVSNWRPDYVVGITRGGLVAAVMISKYLDVPLNTLSPNESNLWMAEDAFGYDKDPMNILIVDDVNDSGNTFKNIKEDWRSGCMPDGTRWNEMWGTNVRFATVFNNSASDVEVTYMGEEINMLEDDLPYLEFPYENWWA